MIQSVLFDLDGTFIDTALDMGAALNNLLLEEGLDPLPLDDIRPFVSQGGLVLTRLGFASHVEEDAIEPLRLRYLQHYRDIIAVDSKLFDGFETILSFLEEHGIKWGIVTNKPGWLTEPLLAGLKIESAVVISGDTLEKRKPHPLPLLVAAEQLGVECARSIYVGDDERDIIAGKAAGMKTLVAKYGYIPTNIDIETWQADGVLDTPLDLLKHPLLDYIE